MRRLTDERIMPQAHWSYEHLQTSISKGMSLRLNLWRAKGFSTWLVAVDTDQLPDQKRRYGCGCRRPIEGGPRICQRLLQIEQSQSCGIGCAEVTISKRIFRCSDCSGNY